MSRYLVLGGVRSGKTALAERLATASGKRVVYVATATAGDDEMAARIRRHQEQRPASWGLVEESLNPGGVLDTHAVSGDCLLVDCMSLWVSNLLHVLPEKEIESALAAFTQKVADYPGSLVIVSNEVGLGVIGTDPLTRAFCDRLGWLNQALAARVDTVVLSVAGCPLLLKGRMPHELP